MASHSKKERERVWNLCLIQCDDGGEPYVLCVHCRMPVEPGDRWDICHVGVPAAHEGDTGGVGHHACNMADAYDNVIPMVAKGKRIWRHHVGINEPGLSPQALPFGKRSKLKRKLNGQIVPRRSGNQQHHDLMNELYPHGRPGR